MNILQRHALLFLSQTYDDVAGSYSPGYSKIPGYSYQIPVY